MPPEGTRLAAGVRCVGYVRVSTERQAGEVYTSLGDQEAAIVALASRMGAAVDAWYRDEGASGATVAKRPAFRQLLADCLASARGAGALGLVLVLNDSRFGRFPDPDEAAALRFRLKQAGWVVRFAESDDSEDVTSRSILRALGSAQASEYRKQLQRNSRRGKRGTATQGFWTTKAPIGYQRKVVHPVGRERVLARGVAKAKDEKVILVPDPATAPLVREVFTRYASGGASLAQLADVLRLGAPAFRWSRSAVAAILRNPAYLGHIVGGKRAPLDALERLTAAPTTAADWYGKQHAHEALVSPELFAAVEARLGENRHARQHQTKGSPFVLSGLLTCAHCGAGYTGGGSSHVSLGHSPAFRFYRDTGGVKDAHRPARCPGKVGTVGKHLVEPLVLGMIRDAFGQASVRRQVTREVDRLLVGADDAETAARTRLEGELRTLTARRDRLVAAIGDGALTASEASAQLAPVRARLTAITEELAAQAQVLPLATQRDLRALVQAAAADLPRLLRHAAPSELRTLLRPWVESCTFDKVTRELVVALRLVPALSPLLPSTLAAQSGQEEGQRSARRIVRRVIVTRTAARQAAGGAA